MTFELYARTVPGRNAEIEKGRVDLAVVRRTSGSEIVLIGRGDVLTTTNNAITVTPSLQPVEVAVDPAVSVSARVVTLTAGGACLSDDGIPPRYRATLQATCCERI